MSRLLIDESPLQVLPSLASAVGLNEAIFLQQLHYWLQKGAHDRDGRRWVYNTYAGWKEQFPFWSERTIQRVVVSLRKQGLLITTDEYNKLGIDNTLWYAIDYIHLDKLTSRLDKLATPSRQLGEMVTTDCLDHHDKLSTPLPETTTETTTETTQKNTKAPVATHRGARKPAAPPTPKHQAVIAFHEQYKRWPKGSQEAAIVDRATDLELWRSVLSKWALRGYNPMNIDGQLDWYVHPEKMDSPNGVNKSGNYNGRNRAGSGQGDGGSEPALDPEIQRRMDEHRERRKAEGSLYYNRESIPLS